MSETDRVILKKIIFYQQPNTTRFTLKRFIFQMGLLILFCWANSFSQTMERLSLHDAITIALKNNPQSLASSQQIDVERGRFWRGISPPLPSVSVSYDYIPKEGSVKQFGERTVEVSQSLDFHFYYIQPLKESELQTLNVS
jgi:hypothetical protein